MTFQETHANQRTLNLSYGASYLCREKSMIVSLGYCEHCSDCRSSKLIERPLECRTDAYA